jgi:acetyl esterase/lipase
MRPGLICALLFSSLLVSGRPGEEIPRGQEIRLWPSGAPGSEGETAPEVSQPSTNPKLPKSFSVVHYPSIFVFLPPSAKMNGMAMVVAPGGGHSQLVIEKEGWQIADWLNKNGIAAFVLKYRLAKAPGSHYTVTGNELADAARAVRLVRSRANDWGVDPKRIGFMGFSAGGEVAALIETRFDAGKATAADPVDRVSSRPDFTVLVYPGTSASPVTVPNNAPPAFLVCADDDPSHVVNSVNLYLDLQKQGVSSEMHIYASGKHGFAMRESTLPVATWPDRLKDWMVDRHLLQWLRPKIGAI